MMPDPGALSLSQRVRVPKLQITPSRLLYRGQVVMQAPQQIDKQIPLLRR